MSKEGKSMKELKSLIKEFVERFSHLVGFQWGRGPSRETFPKLPVEPYSKDYEERRKAAHYFLLVASVDEDELVGRAENARRLLVKLHHNLGDKDFYQSNKSERFKEGINLCPFREEFGPEKEAIPRTLVSVNDFVREKANGDLIKYSKSFSKPKEMVDEIAANVERMKRSLKDKSWMYMRWMVRPKPDLHIFNHFSPEDLSIPLTPYVANVAVCLGLIKNVDDSLWENEEEAELARGRLTQFAKELFPDDPAKADYPFYILGRSVWPRGKALNRETLRKTFCKNGIKHIDALGAPVLSISFANTSVITDTLKIRSETSS